MTVPCTVAASEARRNHLGVCKVIQPPLPLLCDCIAVHACNAGGISWKPLAHSKEIEGTAQCDYSGFRPPQPQFGRAFGGFPF